MGAVRILLLEDSDIDAELISRYVSKVDIPVGIQRAASRQEYLDALEAGDIDLTLSDYSLPDFDGLDALALSLQRWPDVPFVFVSGVIGEEIATEALRAGATDYVLKRDLARIPMVVSRALREGQERDAHQRAIAALRESEERFRTMADSAPALIWSLDEKANVSFLNRRFRTFFGISLERMLEEGWKAILHPEAFEDFARESRAAFNARRPFDTEMRVRLADGSPRWLRAESIPRLDPYGRFLGYTGCAVDMTELKLATDMLEAEVAARTEELRHKDEELRQSQKMEAIGQLTGGIAHDFNNMLAGILGSADMLKRRFASGRFDNWERYADGISVSANRAAALTNRLLTFARRQSLDIRGTDVNQLVQSLAELLQRTLGESTQLHMSLAPKLWPASTDPNQLENAILNLAINARDAMPEGGALGIVTSNRSVSPSDASAISGLEPGDYVVIVVSDTGMGMPPEVLEKAFDPFYTTKPIGQGTGLGLSTIYGFTKQIGGHIRITSKVGEGTVVALYLPREANESEDEASTIGADAMTETVEDTILVVEDEPIVRMLVVDFLSELGYAIVEAKDANAALPILKSDQPISLLLTDVGLPGMSGRQLADAAREIRPDLKVLFATGYAEGAGKRADFLGEGMELVSKPFDLDFLAEKVRQMTGG